VIEIYVVPVDDDDDFERYAGLVGEILGKDEQFKALINRFGEAAYVAAICLIAEMMPVFFAAGILPGPAADKIREKFYEDAKGVERDVQRQREIEAFYTDILNNARYDRTH
jgi:hypothetical protein